MKKMTRRTFLKSAAASAAALTAAGVLGACGGSSSSTGTSSAAGSASQAAGDPTEAGNAPSGDKVSLTLGTGGTSGTYYAVGGVLATVLNEKLMNSSLNVTSTGASKANIQMIEDGEADLAIVQNDVMSYAAAGTDLFEGEGAYEGFRTVCGIYAETCQVVCSADIKSFEDLKGKKVVVGDAGSGTEFNAQQILTAYGISYDDFDVQYGSFGDIADQIKDGLIDAGFVTAGAPTTAVTDLATSKDINILTVDDEHIEKLVAEHPFYTKNIIPGGTYKGLDEDIQTVAVKATLIASVNVADDVIYELTQAIFDNLPALIDGHAKFGELSLESAVDGIDVDFHPGAEAYFKDQGIL